MKKQAVLLKKRRGQLREAKRAAKQGVPGALDRVKKREHQIMDLQLAPTAYSAPTRRPLKV